MKRSIIPLITAGLLAGAGVASAQLVNYDAAANDYVSANKNFGAKPLTLTTNECQPASGYSGLAFTFAGVTDAAGAINMARVHNNDRMQIQDNEDFSYMVTFDFAAANVANIQLEGSTFGAGTAGDATYLVLHDSTQSYSNGWYASLLHDRTTVSSYSYAVPVKDATWTEFTPSSDIASYPLGTTGAVVNVSTITNMTFDKVGYYAEVDSNGANANHYLWKLVAEAPVDLGPLHPTLAYFDTTFSSPDFTVPELTGAVTGGNGKDTNANSTDGTFGDVMNPDAAKAPNTAFNLYVDAGNPNKSIVTLTLDNTSTKEIYLDDINFDAARYWENAPKGFILETSGDISTSTLTNLASGLVLLNGKTGDADDFGLTLTNLLDNTLEPGGQAVFTWTFNNNIDGAGGMIDNVLIGGTVSPFYPAALQASPATVSMSINASDETDSSNVEVSYVAGNPATNVNVSSVTIISDSSVGGFSVSPGSFVLNSPAPVNQLVVVDYDNAAASSSIGVNQSATADVQLIWNEVGSALVSTSTVPVSVAYAGASAENLLAVWNHNSLSPGVKSPDISFTGVDAKMSAGIGWGANNAGSTDGSYGSVVVTGTLTSVRSGVLPVNVPLTMSITNNTENILQLDSFNFDAMALWGGPEMISVSMAGDLGSSDLLVEATVPTSPQSGDWADYDIPLDMVLQNGEYISFTFTFTGSGNNSGLDNIALIGQGFAPATLGRVPGGPNHPWLSMGVSGLDTSASALVDLMFGVGDLNESVSITAVTVSNTTHAGALSASGSYPVLLPTPDVTNSAVFSLDFDNTIADLAAGEFAEAVVSVEWYEGISGPRYFEFLAYGDRPAVAPSNTIIALWDTEFYTPDAAYNGVLGGFTAGTGIQPHNDSGGQRFGSKNGTYGTRVVNPPAPGNGNDDLTCWRFQMNEPSTSLTVTNQTTAAIELSELAFDIGRWYVSFDNFTLGVSGDVTADPAFFVGDLYEMGWEESIKDYDEYDVDLTTLADHTLEAGESVTFTFSIPAAGPENYRWIGIYLDNIALFGNADQLGGWANHYGLTSGVNDGPGQNPDGDGKDNLMEYATGGDPMTADGSAATMWTAEEGGTNWMYHVHNERQDDDSLSYDVGTKGHLQYDPAWDDADAEEVGATTGPGLWHTVTNRTEINLDKKFIGLEVSQ